MQLFAQCTAAERLLRSACSWAQLCHALCPPRAPPVRVASGRNSSLAGSRTIGNRSMFIAAFAGARPLGRPLPPLADAPQCCGSIPLHLIFSFARDAAHDGHFTFYDPAMLEQCSAQLCGAQRGMLSLAGSGFAWGPTVSLDAWVGNALSSLQGLLERHRLTGLDINYEEGLEAGGFPEAMAALIAQLKAWRPQLLITISPYTEVWPHYRQLLQLAASSIDYVNWQVYAELESPGASAQQVVAAYDRLAREVGGYQCLTLGVNTEPDQRRGPQLAACLDAFRQLRAKGIGGAFTWALDNSAAGGYQAERALLAIAAEPWQARPAQHAEQQWQGVALPLPLNQQDGGQQDPEGSRQHCCGVQ